MTTENSFFKEVGNNIQRILIEQGRTQLFLAERLGISKQVMSKIIAGGKAINVMEIIKIADALKVSADELLSVGEVQEPMHHFSFMGQVKNEATKRKIETLQTVIDEILMLEEYEDER